jgi:hypothetical protein
MEVELEAAGVDLAAAARLTVVVLDAAAWLPPLWAASADALAVAALDAVVVTELKFIKINSF